MGTAPSQDDEGAGGFGRETEQARSGQNLIELTKVVEQNLGFRLARQIRVSAQISQDAIANSATRDLAKLFLDGLERFARSPLLSSSRAACLTSSQRSSARSGLFRARSSRSDQLTSSGGQSRTLNK